MLFSFALGGTDAKQLALLEDALRPLFYGLRRAGHRVISFAHGLAPPPAVNILVEHEAADIGRRVAEGRQEIPGVRIGIVCPDGLEGVTANAERWTALRGAAVVADFIWVSTDAAPVASIAAPDRLAAIDYGFDPIMLGRRLVPEPARRDVDLVIYGVKTEHRVAIAERLKAADLLPFVVEPGRFPDYLVSDLLSRAKVVLVTRDSEAERAPSAARLAKAICNGAAVIAEAPRSGACPLAGYVTVCAPDDFPGRCCELIAEGRFVEHGLERFERFRAETSMAANLAAALALVGEG